MSGCQALKMYHYIYPMVSSWRKTLPFANESVNTSDESENWTTALRNNWAKSKPGLKNFCPQQTIAIKF